MFIKNIKNFIVKNTLMFVMLVLTQLIAVNAILMAYGIYSDSKYSVNSVKNVLYSMDINSSGSEYNDSVKIIKEIFPDIVQDVSDELDDIVVWTVGTFDEPIPIEKFKENNLSIKTDDEYKYKTNVVSMFTIKDGKYKYDDSTKRYMSKITEEEWYSEESANSGEPVCVVSNDFAGICGSEVSINGISYKIEVEAAKGEGFSDQIAVPLQAMADDLEFSALMITFKKPLLKSKYDELAEKFEDALGDRVVIEDYCSASLDEIETYRTLMAIAVSMSVIASFIVCLIYRYILELRIRATGIYLVCGSTRLSAALVYIKEMVVILGGVGNSRYNNVS